jgi:biotin carboxylase
MRNVVLIDTNFTGLDAIAQLCAAGHRVILITKSTAQLKAILPSESLRVLDRLSETFETPDTNDFSALAALITELARTRKIDAIYTFAQPRTIVASRLARHFGLPGADPRAVETASRKDLLRQTLAREAISPVRYAHCPDLSHLAEAVTQVGLPCIVKPCQGHSSIGVQRIASLPDLPTVTRRLMELASVDASRDFLVEELLEGPLFSVESITIGPGEHFLLGMCDRILSDAFVELGATFPVRIADEEACFSVVKAALDAIGFDLGPCHTEVIVTENGPRIVEINPRAGGAGISRLIEKAYPGRKLPLEIVELILGRKPDRFPASASTFSMRSVLIEKEGTIRGLPSREELLACPGLLDVWFHKNEGDSYRPVTSNFSWILTLLSGPSPGLTSRETAETAAKYAEARIVIS